MKVNRIFKFNGQDVIVVEDNVLKEYNLTSLAEDEYGEYHIVSLEEAEIKGVGDEDISYPDDGYELEGGEEIGVYDSLDSDYSLPYNRHICTLDWHEETTIYFNYGTDGGDPYKGGKLEDLMKDIKVPEHPTSDDIERMEDKKAEYDTGLSFNVPASELICSFEDAFRKVNDVDYNEWKDEAEKIANAAEEPFTEEELELANQIMDDTISQNSPIDWGWIHHLQRQNSCSEMFDWAYINVRDCDNYKSSDKVLRKAAWLLVDYLKD